VWKVAGPVALCKCGFAGSEHRQAALRQDAVWQMAVMFAARRRLVCVCGGESVQRLPRLGAVMFVLADARPKRKGPGGALLLERYAALHHGINLKQRARAASLPCSLPARPDQA